ncbi:hypothetical protein PRZ48_005854 [Zasmidium cellare]|uniref:Zn(2)-C6 fungal-type domain-containing protein n=1 Tax=Zasmidium cellare TaxID=395010 RepID=A0ABR0ELF5_ZASCE|nr:hypothetical protein PRZ48_005854 [Zasmidium cellare]
MSGLMPAAGLSESAPGFHVFAIRPRLGAGQVEGALDANTKQYSTRKSHRKSRLGCNACKQKRVKCDEKQPRCGRCERTKKPCGYSSSGSLTQATSDCVGASKGHATNSNRRTDCSYATPIPYPLEKSNRDIHLLKHYDRITGLEQDTVTCSDILVGSQASNYLSALHFNHFDVEGYRLAKFSHLQIALSDLQSAISGPITQRQADPVLLASMMINMQ